MVSAKQAREITFGIAMLRSTLCMLKICGSIVCDDASSSAEAIWQIDA
jgi:hypothetical protein